VREAIAEADAVVVCPSNPVSSIGPMLAIRGIAQALATTTAEVVAVSPIIGRTPVSGPAGKMMAARGLDVSAAGVARAYQSWVDTLLVDEGDALLAPEIELLGVRPVLAPILMGDRAREIALARVISRTWS
jgi:LPPG:FO 2-phospho-L-lactate transferase